jgi:hypothetical protein
MRPRSDEIMYSSVSAEPLLLQVILVLLAPLGTLVFGDLISRILLRGVRSQSPLSRITSPGSGFGLNRPPGRSPDLKERLLIDFVTGTAFSISLLLLAGLAGVLVPAEAALTLIFCASFGYWSYRALSNWRGFPHYNRPGKLGLATAMVYIGYLVKVGIVMATRPIQDYDAMSLYIPAGKAFTALSSIPVYDPFHFWNTWFEPGLPLLYSWAFTLSGSVQSEAYRAVPLLPFMLLPVAVYAFVLETFKSREAASISLILTVFMPGVDFMLYFYALYTDVFTVLLALIALTFYQRIPSEKFGAEMIVGMSLGLTLIFHYYIGIFATAFVALMVISKTSATPSVIRMIRTLGVLALSAGFVWGANNGNNLLANGDVVYFTLIVVIGALVAGTYLSPVEPGQRIGLRNLVVIPIFMLPSIVWGARSVLVGNGLFGVNVFLVPRPPSGLPADQLPGLSPSFGLLTVITPFVHPWFNAFFFPITIMALIFAARTRNSAAIVPPFLLYFLLYLTVVYAPPSGRQLMLDGILVVAMIAFFLTEYKPLRTSFLRYAILIFYCATSVLAWPTLYFYALGSPYDSLLNYLGLVATKTSYYATDSLGIIAQHGLPLYEVLVATIGLRYILGADIGRADRVLKRIGTVAVISILIVGSFIQFVPYLEFASSTTNGNILSFSNSPGNYGYYQYDIEVAVNVSKIIPTNSCVITFATAALPLVQLCVLDLYRGGIGPLTQAQGLDGGNLSTTLIENGFGFLLLPAGANFLWTTFQAYVNATPLLQAILADRYIVPVIANNYWTLYEIEAPS